MSSRSIAPFSDTESSSTKYYFSGTQWSLHSSFICVFNNFLFWWVVLFLPFQFSAINFRCFFASSFHDSFFMLYTFCVFRCTTSSFTAKLEFGSSYSSLVTVIFTCYQIVIFSTKKKKKKSSDWFCFALGRGIERGTCFYSLSYRCFAL